MEDVWFDDVDSETLEAANQGKPYTSKKTASSDKPQTAVQPKPLVTGDCKQYVNCSHYIAYRINNSKNNYTKERNSTLTMKMMKLISTEFFLVNNVVASQMGHTV